MNSIFLRREDFQSKDFYKDFVDNYHLLKSRYQIDELIFQLNCIEDLSVYQEIDCKMPWLKLNLSINCRYIYKNRDLIILKDMLRYARSNGNFKVYLDYIRYDDFDNNILNGIKRNIEICKNIKMYEKYLGKCILIVKPFHELFGYGQLLPILLRHECMPMLYSQAYGESIDWINDQEKLFIKYGNCNKCILQAYYDPRENPAEQEPRDKVDVDLDIEALDNFYALYRYSTLLELLK